LFHFRLTFESIKELGSASQTFTKKIKKQNIGKGRNFFFSFSFLKATSSQINQTKKQKEEE